MQVEAHDTPVYLGFAAPYDAADLYRLNACFLPLGKVGGKPAWLNPVAVPRSEDMLCKVCSKPLCFLLQVYATNENDEAHSFHRTLFLFVCRDPKCSKANDASNLAAFRCGVPRDNAWYPSAGPLDPDLVGPDELPGPPEGAPALCRVCGCYAAKKCAKCGDAWYCCRDHQALDWTKGGHKSACGQKNTGDTVAPEEERRNPENAFLFEEMGMEMDREALPSMDAMQLSDSEGEEDDDEPEEKRLEEYKKMVKAKRLDESALANEDLDDEVEEKKDKCFSRFNRILDLNAEQIVRYQRGGRPLPPTDKAPEITQVPPCALCGAPRAFELQLTPHLLSVLGVDELGESIDWASVYVYTCSANCEIANAGYAKEHVEKHDFVE